MKVYVVTWFDGEPYSLSSGVDSVHPNLLSAEKYLLEVGLGPHDEDLDNHYYGYYLSKHIEEFTILNDTTD